MSSSSRDQGPEPALQRADIRPLEESSGWIFRDVRMELANDNALTAQSAVFVPFRPMKRETRTGSILTSRKIHPEAGYPADTRRISALRRAGSDPRSYYSS